MMESNLSQGWVPLTSRQLSIWLELQSSGTASSYQIGGFSRIACLIDPRLFASAVEIVMDRHEALRLQIDPVVPRQRVVARFDAPVEVIDLSGESDPEAAFLALADAMIVRPFELSHG